MKFPKFLSFVFAVSIALTAIFCGCSKSPTEPNNQNNELDFKIGQMIILGFNGTEISDTSHIYADIVERHIGGVVLYARNVESPSQLQSLDSALQSLDTTRLFIAVDQEGGYVARLTEAKGFSPSVTAQYLGEINNPDTTRYWAGLCATDLNTAGININFAPVVDLNINPDSPAIGHWERSFSVNPDTVVANALVFIEEHHALDIYCTLKHFPGHGSSTEDSHYGLPDITATWSEIELEPYEDIIAQGQCDIVMTAHVFNGNLDATYPATLSSDVITGILRDELAWDGVVISDDMHMAAINDNYGLETALELCINAGVDMLIFSNNSSGYYENAAQEAIDLIRGMVDDGRISESRIDEAYQRITQLKHGL